MLARSWKKAEYIAKAGKKNNTATAILNKCLNSGWVDGMRTKTLPRGYAIMRHEISCSNATS